MATKLSRRQLASYAIDQLGKASSSKKLAKQLAATLLASKKTGEAELLVADIYDELERRGEMARANLTSARELSQSLKAELKLALAKATGVKRIILDEMIDKDIIGGFVLSTSRHSWDKSIASLLTRLKGGR